jgi:DUF4097 and DUF4098 domain-containing protein YvlB
LLEVDLLNGAISVTGYNGKDVIVDAEPRDREPSSPGAPAGLRRLQTSSTGLRIEEQNNVMTVQADSVRRYVRLNIQVPSRTNLKLHSVNGGAIEVERVEGDIDINNTNGRVTAKDVAGAVKAQSINGGVLVTMSRVTPGKTLSFTSQNGTVDVTLPPDVKANAKLRTGHGDIWTDFDVQVKQSPAPVVEDSRAQGGRYRIDIDRNIYGTINGGGPDLTLSTFNGSIYIRRGK